MVRPAQVIAAALAALTAAFLGSTLGVYGTVAGAGIVSLLTTVGSEFYLRSLERTKQAALRTKEAAFARTAKVSPLQEPAEDDDRTTSPEPERKRAVRWQVLAGATVAAFALGMVAVTGIEALTGGTLSGGNGSTVTNVLRGGQDQQPHEEASAPEEPEVALTTPPPATTTVAPPPSEPATTTETVEPSGEPGGQPTSETSEQPESSDEPTPSIIP